MPGEAKLQFNRKRFRGFTGNQLKMIAFLLMLCDHTGYMLIENGVLYGQNPYYWNLALATPEGQKWFTIAVALRLIGRLAFPIFAFFTVEGFIHTSSLKKYILRLSVFALVSEVPFDLACRHKVLYPDYQNVLFTLLLGVLAMALINSVRKKPLVLKLLIAAAFSAAAWLIRSDYGALGVALICLIYLLQGERTAMLWTGAAVSAAESIDYLGISALSFLLIKYYNGKRGAFALKYFFYLMYPLHLILFWFLVYYNNR